MLFQSIEQNRREAEIALHKFGTVLRTVNTGKIKNKIGIFTRPLKLVRGGINIVKIYCVNFQPGARSVLAVPNIFKRLR